MSITEKLNTEFEEGKQSEEEYEKYSQELVNKERLRRIRSPNVEKAVFIFIPKILKTAIN